MVEVTEIWFYHLQNQPLARALPALVEKALGRGWRIGIQTAPDGNLKALDDLLWTYAPDSFIPHGLASDPGASMQPVILANDEANPNGAALRIFTGQAEITLDPAGRDYERAILLFDGRDDDEVTAARRQWTRLKSLGFPLAYWQQTGEGRWDRKS